MPLTDTALEVIADAIIGGTAFDPFDSVNAHLGVGDGTTAFDPTQTDLQGSSTTRKPMDSGFPQRGAEIDSEQRGPNEITFQATFGTGDANFDWREWGVFNAAADGQMLNRVVENLGTKTSAATWQFLVDVAFVHGA